MARGDREQGTGKIIRHKRPATLTALCMLILSTAEAGSSSPLGAVETFFEAMETNNWALAEPVMLSDAVLYGYRIENGDVVLARVTAADYLESMRGRNDRLLERIWDVEILQHDRLATVWTPYDFYLNGEFHHCGRNSFSLIRDEQGWQIASVVYSMLAENCEASPLGPPEPR